MTAHILQFPPSRVSAARAELLAHARDVLATSQFQEVADILNACDYLQDWGDAAERLQARVVRRRVLRTDAERRALIAERMRDQEAAARETFTMPPRRGWPGIIAGAVAFVAVWWVVLVAVML